jgi:hypothetical protein
VVECLWLKGLSAGDVHEQLLSTLGLDVYCVASVDLSLGCFVAEHKTRSFSREPVIAI